MERYGGGEGAYTHHRRDFLRFLEWLYLDQRSAVSLLAGPMSPELCLRFGLCHTLNTTKHIFSGAHTPWKGCTKRVMSY